MLASWAAAVALLLASTTAITAQATPSTPDTTATTAYRLYFSFAPNSTPNAAPIQLRLGDGTDGAMLKQVLNPVALAADRTMGYELRLSEPFAQDICQVAILFRPKGVWYVCWGGRVVLIVS